jgi:hypothetical protein
MPKPSPPALILYYRELILLPFDTIHKTRFTDLLNIISFVDLMVDMTNVHRTLFRNPKERVDLEDLGIEGGKKIVFLCLIKCSGLKTCGGVNLYTRGKRMVSFMHMPLYPLRGGSPCTHWI